MPLLECTGCGGMVSDNTDFCSQCGQVIEKKSKSKGLRIVGAVILFPLVVLSIFSMGGGNFISLPGKDTNQGALSPAISEEKQVRTAPTLGHKVRSLAIKKMSQNESVVDAAINQEGDEISFLLIVAQGTSRSEAERLGEDFVRSLEEHSKEIQEPGEAFVQASYRYLIGVYTPDQHRIALASKSRNETGLNW